MAFKFSLPSFKNNANKVLTVASSEKKALWGSGIGALYLGYFVDPTALNTAYPTGIDGNFANIGSTDTIWVWDSGTNAWVDTGVAPTSQVNSDFTETNPALPSFINNLYVTQYGSPDVFGVLTATVPSVNWIELASGPDNLISLSGFNQLNYDTITIFPTIGAVQTIQGGIGGFLIKLANNAPSVQLDGSNREWISVRWDPATFQYIQVGGKGFDYIAMPSREIVIQTLEPEIFGKQYQTFANAFAYIATQSPSSFNTFTIRFTGANSESFVIPQFVTVVGDDPSSSVLSGNVSFLESSGFLPFPGNNIANCTTGISALGTTTPVVSSNYLTGSYAPDYLYFNFDSVPSSGTYTLTINGLTTAPIAWNANAAAVQGAIVALGIDFINYVVIDDAGNPNQPAFIINCYGSPVGATTFNATNSTDASGITTSDVPGIVATSGLYFNAVATAGNWMLWFSYNSVYYYSNSFSPLVYNATDSDVLVAIQDIFTQIQVAEGIDLGIATVSVTGDMAVGFTINYNGAPGALGGEIIQVELGNPLNYTLTYGAFQYMALDNVRLTGAFGTPNLGNNMLMKNSIIIGGDYTSFNTLNGGMFNLFDSQVMSFGHLGIPELPDSINADSCSFNSQNIITFNGGTFKNSTFIGTTSFMVFNPGVYKFYNCTFDGDIVIPAGATFTFFNCDVSLGFITIDLGGILYNYGSPIASITNNGTFTNFGDYYNNNFSGLTSTNVQDAIDEMSVLTSALTVNTIVWDGADSYSTFYAANNISILTFPIRVALSGTGHTVDAGTMFLNSNYLTLVADKPTIVVFADGSTMSKMFNGENINFLSYSTTTVIDYNINTYSTNTFWRCSLTVTTGNKLIELSNDLVLEWYLYDCKFADEINPGSVIETTHAQGEFIPRVFTKTSIFNGKGIYGTIGELRPFIYDAVTVIDPTFTNYSGTLYPITYETNAIADNASILGTGTEDDPFVLPSAGVNGSFVVGAQTFTITDGLITSIV